MLHSGYRHTSQAPTKRRFMMRLATLLLLGLSCLTQAGWLDNIKKSANEALNNADQALEDIVTEGIGPKESPANKTPPQETPAPSPPKPSPPAEPQETQVADDHWKSTATFEDDAARGIKFIDAPSNSRSVLNMPLRGIRLGMPARIADRLLNDAGLGYQSGGDTYVMEVRNVNGEEGHYRQEDLRGKSASERGTLVKRYMIRFLSKPVSTEFTRELDGERQAMIEQANAIYSKEMAEREAAAAEFSRSREGNRVSSSRQTYARFSGQPVSLIYYIEYTQIIGSEQKFNYQKALEQAKQFFGPPNYNPGSSHARAGAAYQTSPKYNLVYADVLLTEASEKEAMVRQAAPEQHYVMKQGMSHPCSGVMRGRCVNGASVAHAFPGDLKMQLKLARLQGAPFMLVSPQTASGMKIIQEWQYLISADSIRSNFAKRQVQKAKPEAGVDF